MNLGNFLSGLIKKTGVIFADDFDIKKVDSLNNALNNIVVMQIAMMLW